MPASAGEAILGRALGWTVVAANVGIVLLLVGLMPVAVGDGWAALELAVFGALIVAWGTGTWGAAVLLVVRPRHSAGDLLAASPAGDRELRVPGSARSSRAQALTAATWLVLALLGAILASPGWKIVLIVVAVALTFAVIDQGLAARQPRYLALTATELESGAFGGAAAVRWEDIESIASRQGPGGQLVFRVQAKTHAPSWNLVSRHPWHRVRGSFDVEPLSLDVDPVLLGAVLFSMWEDDSERDSMSASALATRLVEPEWALSLVEPPVAAALMRMYRPERKPPLN